MVRLSYFAFVEKIDHISDALRELVPFVPFKKREKRP